MSGTAATNDTSTPNPLIPTDAPQQEITPKTAVETENLTEFEKGVVAEFEAKAKEQTDGTDSGTDSGTDGEGGEDGDTASAQDPASTPEPASEDPDADAPTSAAPDPSEAAQGQPGADGGDSADGATPDPHSDAPAEYLGRPRADVETALQTYDWLRSLPAQALQGVDAYLSGGYVLVPADQVPPVGATPNSAPAGGQPSRQPSGQDDDDLDDLDPAVARRLQKYEEELAALRQSTQSQVQSQVQQREQALLSAIDVGSEEFSKAHGLEAADLERVQEVATRLGTMQTGLAVYPNDLNKAVVHALDLAYYSDATLRQREIDRVADQRAEEERRLAERKRKAGAVSSASGSVVKPAPKPPEKMTAQEREEAIAQELAQAMAR